MAEAVIEYTKENVAEVSFIAPVVCFMIAQHSKEGDCWIILGNDSNGDFKTFILQLISLLGGEKVYDVSKYLNEHPGGPEIILEYAGLAKLLKVLSILSLFRKEC